MTVYSSSRYATGWAVVQDDDSSGVMRRFPTPFVTYFLYTWEASDRMDLVAARYHLGAANWWRIMDANPLLQNPTDVLPGQQIRIPKNA